jgi:hypothetical protein
MGLIKTQVHSDLRQMPILITGEEHSFIIPHQDNNMEANLLRHHTNHPTFPRIDAQQLYPILENKGMKTNLTGSLLLQ